MKQSIVVGGICIGSAIRHTRFADSICFLLLIASSLSADEILFNEHVRPILVEHCLQCHGPDESRREAELRLDSEDAAKESVIVAGDPELSSFM
ncbi:MAG: hypothetical protein CMJ77_08065 [Planctomycetaceae bacterium]|nr:hypothetical protein [Planctomycetaceae bacterium]